MIRVWHGTCAALAPRIWDEGLRGRDADEGWLYVALHPAIAEQFAYVCTEHFHHVHESEAVGAVFTAEVEIESLRPDPQDSYGWAWRTKATVRPDGAKEIRYARPGQTLGLPPSETVRGPFCPVCDAPTPGRDFSVPAEVLAQLHRARRPA